MMVLIDRLTRERDKAVPYLSLVVLDFPAVDVFFVDISNISIYFYAVYIIRIIGTLVMAQLRM